MDHMESSISPLDLTLSEIQRKILVHVVGFCNSDFRNEWRYGIKYIAIGYR